MPEEPEALGHKRILQLREALAVSPEIDRTAQLIALAGNATRLKLLYLLGRLGEVKVTDLSAMLGVSLSAVSQHLTKLRAYGLVQLRRQAQTVYYSLAENPFTRSLEDDFFPKEDVALQRLGRRKR